ncbi:GerAB/ArcD/ProY family transporter [Priestia aryabhattai]|uniref:GerAB/ArcD/ProY family transporter n=1 Tax=Priestia aryabhattai TaxID=412384 RepID=UPI003D2E9B95
MQIQRIGTFQLFTMAVLSQLGSAIVLGIGSDAKKDAWIALLVGTICGIGLFFLYVCSYQLSRERGSLLNILQEAFNRPIGYILAFLYYGYFIYLAARVTADFSFFMNEVLFININMNAWLIKATILLLVAYACYLGIETIGRTSENLFFIMLSFTMLVVILMFFQEQFEFKNLRPIVENGWMPIFRTVFPTIITFPFGESIVLLCFFQFLTAFSTFLKKGWLSILVSGSILIFASILNVGVLTADLAKDFNFPFIKTIEHINFLNFIRHLELLAILIFMIGGLIKILLFSYAGITGMSELFKMNSYKKMIIPLLSIIYLICVLFMNNYVIHIYIGLKVIPVYVHLFFQIFIPVLFFISLLIKKQTKQTKPKRN